jgi:hypothetical protein
LRPLVLERHHSCVAIIVSSRGCIIFIICIFIICGIIASK